MTETKKEYLTLYIDSEVKRRFYDYVKSTYKSMHGGLSIEGEQAIRKHLLTHTQGTNGQAQIGEPVKINPEYPHTHVYMDRIIQVLRNDFECLLQCSSADLHDAITKVRGSDERTISKWVKLLLNERKIKVLRADMYEIV